MKNLIVLFLLCICSSAAQASVKRPLRGYDLKEYKRINQRTLVREVSRSKIGTVLSEFKYEIFISHNAKESVVESYSEIAGSPGVIKYLLLAGCEFRDNVVYIVLRDGCLYMGIALKEGDGYKKVEEMKVSEKRGDAKLEMVGDLLELEVLLLDNTEFRIRSSDGKTWTYSGSDKLFGSVEKLNEASRIR